MTRRLIATLAAAVFMAAPVAAQNLLTNPGFEAGNFSGWTQGGNTDESEAVLSLFAHEGDYEAYFGPIGTIGTLSQSFATTPDDEYLFSFWLDANGMGPSSFEVLWDGMSLLTLSNVNLPEYTNYAFSMEASGPSTTIEFRFLNEPDYWYLDDVSVSAVALEAEVVPEPATMTLLATGLAGLAASRRRKRTTG